MMYCRLFSLLVGITALFPVSLQAEQRSGRCVVSATATRWLASFNSHVPLAVSDGKAIWEAGQNCCAPWSNVGERWRSIDAYGQVVGEAVVKRRTYYDVAKCYDLELKTVKGRGGMGLYASSQGIFKTPDSAAWKLSAKQNAAFEQFAADLRRLIVFAETADTIPPKANRTLFFYVAPRTRNGDVQPPPPNPTRFAALGGPFFAIGFEDPKGRWVLAHLEHQRTGDQRHLVYWPIAVFDVDGDGIPEVIVRFSEGAFFGEDMLRLDPETDVWRRVARSVMGSTS